MLRDASRRCARRTLRRGGRAAVHGRAVRRRQPRDPRGARRRRTRASACSTTRRAGRRSALNLGAARRARRGTSRGWTRTRTTRPTTSRAASSGCERGDVDWVSGPPIADGRRAAGRAASRSRSRRGSAPAGPTVPARAPASEFEVDTGVRRHLEARDARARSAAGTRSGSTTRTSSSPRASARPAGGSSACPRWRPATSRATAAGARRAVRPLRLLPRQDQPAPPREPAPLARAAARRWCDRAVARRRRAAPAAAARPRVGLGAYAPRWRRPAPARAGAPRPTPRRCRSCSRRCTSPGASASCAVAWSSGVPSTARAGLTSGSASR